jgi:predicted deacylase
VIAARVAAAVAVALLAGPTPAVQTAQAADPAWGPLRLLGREIPAGQKRKFGYEAVATFQGAFLDTPIFAARGATPGPTLCITATIHGDELNGFEVGSRVFAETDAGGLAGTLLVVPAVNAAGFRNGSRYMPDRRDLNRFFPGTTKGSNTAQVARAVFDIVTGYCNALVDLHTGSFDRANLPQIRVDLDQPQAVELARSFGVGVVVGGAGPEGSLRRETMKAGIPAIIYEAGLPLRFEPEEIRRGVEGVRNVMAHLGMIRREGPPPPPARVVRNSQWIRAPLAVSGIFYPARALGDTVQAGDILGDIRDPWTDERHAVHAPVAGFIIGMTVPQVVLSGYAVVHIGLEDN